MTTNNESRDAMSGGTPVNDGWPRPLPIVDGNIMLPPGNGTWRVWTDWYEGKMTVVFAPWGVR